jgi:hypothetical protein
VALKPQVLAPGGLDVDARPLRHDAGCATDAVGICDDVDAGDGRLSRVGRGERRQDLDGRRLAGAVGPEQPEDRPLGDAEAESIEGRHSLWIGLHEALRLDCSVHLSFTSDTIRFEVSVS